MSASSVLQGSYVFFLVKWKVFHTVGRVRVTHPYLCDGIPCIFDTPSRFLLHEQLAD